ncbi:PA2779 family protein [Sulfurihydrogenibium subterraneum]|uniref:PA2779 family protein n=1 Tax=Sulfurihydrogenibium subterraneum TaxID=171121 RepID=UPI00048F2394|nr:PA2779 family protein [Sulfurihydrogenibium subterraneum]
MINKFKKASIAFAMAGYMTLLSTAPAPAAMVDSVMSQNQSVIENQREAEINKIQRALENQLVREKLKAYGLTDEEVKQKLDKMSDQQIHMLAQASDKVLAGGDAIGAVIGVLIIVLLIIVILKLLNKEIIIR